MIYKGTALNKPKTINRGDTEEKLFPYIANEELIKSVNLAILLERPLLLMGEPGCGKSRLAQAVAYELYHNEGKQDYKDFYEEWNIKSSSAAKDGLYIYDAIERLGDSQIEGKDLDKKSYVEKREMGLAIEKSVARNKRVILLIDEIDKADIDFPNDLLNELDKGQFTIPETGETITAKVKPIVFITSNGEKDLPDAFLRRCLFHYIDPLNETILKSIIDRRFYADTTKDEDLVNRAIEQFIAIRSKIKQLDKSVGKNVSTSELLDWFEALKYYSELTTKEEETDEALQVLIKDLDKLGKGTTSIPFKQILFKNLSTFIKFDEGEPTDA